MAKKLKDYYDIEYLEHIADLIEKNGKGFHKEKNGKGFHKEKNGKGFHKEKFFDLTKPRIEDLEFNQRQELIAEALKQSFSTDYKETIAIFHHILGPELKGNSGAFSEGWWLWPIGKYVELYGEDDFEVSIDFSKELTKRFTSEYCMRPLIKRYPEETMKILLNWSEDENERVRRLSSECLRIRLPWAKKLYTALDFFDTYIQILSNLKDDKDKYIQKSVANNLNDLYKEKPDKFYAIIEAWKREPLSKECEWVIKHASRNIVK